MGVADAELGTSISSNIFVLVSLLIISLLVLLLLRHFIPLRTTPAFLLIPIFLALALPSSVILLVPVDLSSGPRENGVDSRGVWLPERAMLVAWRIVYWLTFSLTWFILPLLGEYMDSGFRTPKDRILYSLRSNARYQLIVLGCGILGLIYVFLQNGFKGTSVKSLVMALAYCWGLIQAIYLMGHGLVAVPRRLYRNANLGGRLRRLQIHAPKVHEKLEDTGTEVCELEDQVFQLKQRKNGISRDHQEWIEDLIDTAPLIDGLTNRDPSSRPSGAPTPSIITDRYLADLSRRLSRARHKRVRFIERWERLLQEAADIQAILDASGSKRLDYGKASPHESMLGKSTVLTPYYRYLLHSQMIPYARIALASVLSIASVCIVWSELFKYAVPKLSIISVTVIHHRNSKSGKVGFPGQVIASLWIFYMCTAALASFDDVKVWGNRALVRRNTYGESACWYAGQVAKLTVPLAYNFITFLPRDVHQETTFYRFLGRLINLTPLGKVFDYLFPVFILVPVCATLFNLYGKVKYTFGFGILDDDAEDRPTGSVAGGWREGRDLIDRELSGRLDPRSSTLLSSTPSSPIAGSMAPREQQSRNHIRSNTDQRTPVLYVPPAPRNDVARQQADRLSAATQAAEDEDENVFSGFAHRVRNTIDRVERPEWFPDPKKRPKWMGGVDDAESSGRADSGRGLGRWFGGRPSDGRVRLQ